MYKKVLATLILTVSMPVLMVKAEPLVKPLQKPEGIMISPEERKALVNRDRKQVEQINKMEEYIEQLEDALNKQMSISIKCT